MLMPGRKYSIANTNYRYGFNGKENDNEVKGEGNQQDYGMRIYDPRLGRFLSVDPIARDYPELTPYQFSSNSPISMVDLDGLEGSMSISGTHASPYHTEFDVDGDRIPDYNKAFYGAAIVGLAGGGAVVADIFLTKGWASRFLFTYVPAASLFEHNRVKTSEGKNAQNLRARENLTNLAFGYVFGKFVGVTTKLTVASGKVIYKTFQSSSIRFSQSSIKGTDYAAIKSLMKEGKDLGSIDIVKMKDKIYTSLDNKRLMAAQDLGKDIKANAHSYDDALDDVTKERILKQHGVEAKTWGEAIEARTKGQDKYLSRDSPSGSFIAPRTSKN